MRLRRTAWILALVLLFPVPAGRAGHRRVRPGGERRRSASHSRRHGLDSSARSRATTDSEGRYSIAIPAGQTAGSVEVRAALADGPAQSVTATLGPGPVTVNFSLSLQYFDTITVGSRAPGAASEKAVPVDVFTEAQIETAGATETNQIIQALAPSFNFPRPTITDGTDSVRPATLRGLGSDQVLVLLNGKRRHTSALVHVNGSIGRGSTGVDLNAIPASAIRRSRSCATAPPRSTARTRSPA